LVSEDRDVSDAGQQARLFLEGQAEARRKHELVDAQQLADALDLVEAAVPQVSARALPELYERLARAASWARARIERRR
jgi:hypothetical protein